MLAYLFSIFHIINETKSSLHIRLLYVVCLLIIEFRVFKREKADEKVKND